MTELLVHAVSAQDPWTALERLAREPPDDLPELVRARYAVAAREERRRLSWLLGRIGAWTVLLGLLPGTTGPDAMDLVRTLTGPDVRIPEDHLARLLTEAEEVRVAVDAAGFSAEESLAPLVARHLDTPGVRGPAAIALGRLRATAYTGEIVARLPGLAGLEHGAFTVALELMGDPSAIPSLRALLARTPEPGPVWNLHHALVRLTGREPVLPLTGDPVEAIRRAWARPEPPSPPRVTDVERLDAVRARLILRDGAGRIGIEHDPPSPGSSWPVWDKSLVMAGTPVYHVGSDCGTCETNLRLIGWPDEQAAALSGRLRETLRDVPALTAELIDAAAPLLGGLRSGHYLLALADLDLEHVDDPEAAWWYRRIALRDSEEGFADDDPVTQWPGTDHFQLRAPIPGPAYGAVLPTRPLDALAEETVAGFEGDIEAGRRPAAVLLTWGEVIDVEAECEERFLVNVILDGHHKLTAYARRNIPARALLVCRVEDSWGPPEDRGRWLREMTGPLLAT
ncbi:hypothetical protein [Actinomadura sp. DC4]|uniref:hypothetical protein n=1 Tax=Actinomadura sp. DC4 TaxID=3055069 RepID=UPI0025B2441C|nr:hypothetical protein [Actinomadura sp. DC4]MDN3355646.1 hypothetical protein [Actinomadura sp. DC4]